MALINIQKEKTSDGWSFKVEVSEGGSNTSHLVTLTKSYYDKVAKDSCTPEELVERSFRFLLSKEPKESILSFFDLSIINHFFPDFEKSVLEGS